MVESIRTGTWQTFQEISPDTKANPQHFQQEEERYVNALLDEFMQDARRIREPMVPRWDRALRAFKGVSLADPRAPGLSATQFNNIWRILNLYNALLTDAKPRPEISARRGRTEQMHEWADQMKDTVDAIWFMQEVDRKMSKIVYNIELFSKGFAKVIWDPGLAWGTGDISILDIDPRLMWIDRASSLNTSQFICYRAPVPLWEIQTLFPQRGYLVKPDFYPDSFDGSAPSVLPPGSVIRPPAMDSGFGVPRAWVEEWWIRDPAMEGMKLKYPSGRVITRAGANQVILNDSPSPFKDPWPGPWVEFNATFDPDSPWNLNDVEMMIPLQRTLDNLTRYLEDNAAFLTSGIWMAEQRSIDQTDLESKDMLIPRPGKIVWYRPGSKIARDPGSQLPPHLVNVIQMIYQAMESVSGLMDASGAKVPRGVTAGAAIEQLQSSTQAAIRLRSRDIEAGLAMMGQWTINRVLQFYTRKRMLDLLGPDGSIKQTLFDPQMFLQGVQNPDDRYKMFRFFITPGSSLALSKERQYAYHAALYSMGVIDQKALLDAIGYPNRDAIQQRMTAAKAGMPMAQAAVGPTPRGRGANVARKLVGAATGGNQGGGQAMQPPNAA